MEQICNELKQKLNEQILQPVPVPLSKENIDVLANKVHFVITKSYEAAFPVQNSLHLKHNIWWNFERASLQKEARPILLQKSCQKNKV